MKVVTLSEISTIVTGYVNNASFFAKPSMWTDWPGPDFHYEEGDSTPVMFEADAERYVEFTRVKWEAFRESRRESSKLVNAFRSNLRYKVQRYVVKYMGLSPDDGENYEMACLEAVRRYVNSVSEVANGFRQVCGRELPAEWAQPGELEDQSVSDDPVEPDDPELEELERLGSRLRPPSNINRPIDEPVPEVDPRIDQYGRRHLAIKNPVFKRDSYNFYSLVTWEFGPDEIRRNGVIPKTLVLARSGNRLKIWGAGLLESDILTIQYRLNGQDFERELSVEGRPTEGEFVTYLSNAAWDEMSRLR